ncbi:MAG: PQQ-binding-like beta-propeller repeat protein [Planctomycetes bacterium]|nr:PQQ-binding-like beta-propeller repeat protein [Planctomycetota bacterium]
MRMPGIALAAAACALAAAASAGDWPQWGGRDARNMVSDEKGLPASFAPGEKKTDGSGVDMATTRNVKWAVRLGTETYGNPTIADGRIFVGTNNGRPRDPRIRGDRGILMCFEEASGTFLWQLASSKLKQERSFNGDFPQLGITSSPTVEGDRVYLVTNRCEVLCLDVRGLADANDGPFIDEGEYIAVATRRKPGKQPPGVKPDEKLDGPAAPIPLAPTDADIIWRYDMIAELDVWPQDASNCSVLVRGDLVYACTSNGVDLSHTHIPSPHAPSLIALDKRTGSLVAVDDAGIGPRILHGQWSSPSLARAGGRDLLLFGAGDGYLYAFDPVPVDVPGERTKRLKGIWRCDANPPEYRRRGGKPLPYNKNGDGPSEIIGTPVAWNDRVYVTIGQDTRHGPGKGALTCIDATKSGDITATGNLWTYDEINRSMATPSVAGGLVFVADFAGDIHCLDAMTGDVLWVHHLGGQMMGSTLVADGKVYAGSGSGKFVILTASREKEVLCEVHLGKPMHCTPVVANGVLYVANNAYLWAIRGPSLLPSRIRSSASPSSA